MLPVVFIIIRVYLYMCFVFLCMFSDKSAAEKRRQLIQESKFLGGDMEHTHLVKGLDFALLQKVNWQDRKRIGHT